MSLLRSVTRAPAIGLRAARAACAASRLSVSGSAWSTAASSVAFLSSSSARRFPPRAQDVVPEVRFVHRIRAAQNMAPFHSQLSSKTPCVCEVATALSVSELPTALPADVDERHRAFLAVRTIGDVAATETMEAESTKRKRSRKMNKHKWKKRLKAQRRRSRKDLAQ